MTGIRYADLVDGASARIAAGAQAVRLRPFDDRDQARVALRDFHAVLDALETHTWTLITPSRLAGLPAATRAEPVVADAIAMVDGIRELVGPDRPHPSMLDLADRDWAQAALHLRGASDLIGVHLDRWGHPRSPDATTLTDPTARDAALVRVGRQLDTLLATETTLGLRCLQAGLHRAEVSRCAPGPGRQPRLRPPPDPGRPRPAHRGRPGRAAADRRTRAHRRPRPARRGPHPADPPARLGADRPPRLLRRHPARPGHHRAHAHRPHRGRPRQRPHRATRPGSRPAARPSLRAAATWRDLLTDLAAYRAPGPADPHIRADVLALRGLLERLAPLDGTEPADPRTPTLLRAARTTTGQLASTGGRVFAQLADHGHVHVHARDLSLDHIGEDPALLTARIAGARSPPPPRDGRPPSTCGTAPRRPAPRAPSPPTAAPTRELDTAHVLTRIPDTGAVQR